MSLGVSPSLRGPPLTPAPCAPSLLFLVSASPTLPCSGLVAPSEPAPSGPLSPWSPLSPLVHLCPPSSSPYSWSLPTSHSRLFHRIYCPGLRPQSLGTPRSAGQGHHPLRFHDLQPGRGLDQWQGPGLKGQHTDQGKAERNYFRAAQSPGHPEWGLGPGWGGRCDGPRRPTGWKLPFQNLLRTLGGSKIPPNLGEDQPHWDFPGDAAVKNPPASAREAGLIPGLGRSLGGGHGNPLQYS